MNTDIVVYDTNGAIVLTANVSPETLLFVRSEHTNILLNCIGDSHTQYVAQGKITPFTNIELQLKNNLQQGFVWKMPERVAVDARTLPQAKQYCWNKIKASRSIAEVSPFTFHSILYDANVPNISGASQMALIAQGMSQPFSIEWTTHNNSVVTLDGSEMISLGIALGSRNSQVYDTARMLRLEIDSATTNQQVDAITWPS